MVAVPPSSFNVAMIFSASSLGTDSFMTFGALSTNFLESTKLNPSMFLTSLIIFGFDPASNAVSFTVKSDFSAAAGAASSSASAAAAACPPAGPAAGAAAKAPTGRSGMFSRDCKRCHQYALLTKWVNVRLTFKLDTKSAVSRSVNWLIWSTIPTIFGFAASVELCRLAILWWKTELGAPTELT